MHRDTTLITPNHRPCEARMDYELMSPAPASKYLQTKGINHAPSYLANLRVEGDGPQFCRVGKWIRYRRDWLDQYAEGLSSAPMRSTKSAANAVPTGAATEPCAAAA